MCSPDVYILHYMMNTSYGFAVAFGVLDILPAVTINAFVLGRLCLGFSLGRYGHLYASKQISLALIV